MRRSYPESWITYRGIPFRGAGNKEWPLVWRLITDDAQIAQAMGFEAADAGIEARFQKWVPIAEVERWVDRQAYILWNGGTFAVYSEDAASFFIAGPQPFPGAQQREPGWWDATVPARAVVRRWEEEKEVDLSQYRP